MLEIYKSESDLSRKAITYLLKELSIKGFIQFGTDKVLSSYPVAQILANHHAIATTVLSQIKASPLFEKYLIIGVYPYYRENEPSYNQKLQNTINLIIEVDINAVANLHYDMLIKLKKLLITIASSAPFTINVTKLAEKIGD